MPSADRPAVDVAHAFKLLMAHRWLWITPAVVCTLVALGYALLHQNPWQASQSLLIRDEAGAGLNQPGRFDTAESRKTAQEMVLELARSRSVIQAALAEVGAPKSWWRRTAAWPSESDIVDARAMVEVKAPSGAEFGKTELFYIQVKDKNRERSVDLAEAICSKLDLALRELRDQRSASLIRELSQTQQLALGDLEAATAELSAVESSVGGDLSELRLLAETSGGDSNIRQTLVGIDTELRETRTKQSTNAHLLEMITAARDNPQVIVDMPTELLNALPAIKQIKENLVTAQLKRAELLASRTQAHPLVQAATHQQQAIEEQLHRELTAAAGGLIAGIEVGATRMKTQTEQRAEIEQRMKKLGAMRAQYSNLTAKVKTREEVLRKADQNLNNARANQVSAEAASLITLIDSPVTGDRPVGPRKAIILMMGMGGGLAIGLGLLFLTVPWAPPTASRTGANVPTRTAPARTGLTQSVNDQPSRLSLRDALEKIRQGDMEIWT